MTPSGVPVKITSPLSSVMKREMYAMSAFTRNVTTDVVEDCPHDVGALEEEWGREKFGNGRSLETATA